MNEVYLNENGDVFINGNKIEDVESVASKTDFTGTKLVIELRGDYKCDFSNKKKGDINIEQKKT